MNTRRWISSDLSLRMTTASSVDSNSEVNKHSYIEEKGFWKLFQSIQFLVSLLDLCSKPLTSVLFPILSLFKPFKMVQLSSMAPPIFFFLFLAIPWHIEFPGEGSNSSHSATYDHHSCGNTQSPKPLWWAGYQTCVLELQKCHRSRCAVSGTPAPPTFVTL